MNWADYFILGVIGLSALFSLLRGLVKEVLSLVGWVVACWVASRFAGPVGQLLAGMVSLPSARSAIAFIGLALGTLMIFGIANFLIGKLITSTGLGATDKLLGMLFGIGRGLAIITILVMFAGLTPVPGDPWWRQSIFLPRLESVAKLAITWLPGEFGKHFNYERVAPPGGTSASQS